MQVENLTRELSATGDLHTQLTAKVHDLEKENLVLKNRADEVRLKPQFIRHVCIWVSVNRQEWGSMATSERIDS